MKKDDLRNDPIRNNMLSALTFLRKNLSISAAISILIVSLLVFLLSSFEETNDPDYSICYNIEDDSVLKSFCEKEQIKNAIADLTNDKDSNQHILSFLSDFSSKSTKDKLEALNKLDFDSINSDFIKSELFIIYGDILIDKGDLDSGIAKYNQAFAAVDEKKEFSALLNYKIALAFEIKDQIAEANKYIDYALECDYQNPSLARNIDILKSSIAHTLSRSSE
tara:strand:+ start:1641 stop:2306 length:666 start_codon:yes stop_codon:yes gene_type:complete